MWKIERRKTLFAVFPSINDESFEKMLGREVLSDRYRIAKGKF